MIKIKAQDLVFMSKLDLRIDLKAIEKMDVKKDKPFWILIATTENSEYILYGARGG